MTLETLDIPAGPLKAGVVSISVPDKATQRLVDRIAPVPLPAPIDLSERATCKTLPARQPLPTPIFYADKPSLKLGLDVHLEFIMPGFQTPTVLVLVCELGPTFADKFATAKHFSSWLGLCPDNRITGGKVYSVKTRDVNSRIAKALRLAAQNLGRAANYFGDLHRRWRARLGAPKAITAMAHKLARVLWHLLKYKQPFDWNVFAKEEEKMKRKKLTRLQNLTASMNFQLTPLP